MKRSLLARALLPLLALTLVATACGGRDDDSSSGGGGNGGGGNGGGGTEGVVSADDCPDEFSDTAGVDEEAGTIKIVSSFPSSDPLLRAFAQISEGWNAYFNKVNDAGGVQIGDKKYTIETESRDDNYDENRTAENITGMLGENGDGAFAVFNVVGTANNKNIRQDLTDLCVPNLFAATGSPVWGNPEYPWTIGSTLAPYSIEAQAFVAHLQEVNPDAKVGVLIQDDEFGAAYEESLRLAIDGTDIEIVDVKSYKAGTSDVTSQVTSLKGSGADSFFNGATLVACPEGLKAAQAADWEREVTFVSGTCISKTLITTIAGDSSDEAISVTNIKDPRNPQFESDEAMKEYRATIEEFGSDTAEVDNGVVAYGYTQAAIFVQVLESLDAPTRTGVMNAMYAIEGLDGGLLLDGITINTSPEDRFLSESVQLVQYSAADEYFTDLGEILDYEGKTTEITPEEIIND